MGEPLYSRDAILEAMHLELFSRRVRFFDLLREYANRPVPYPGGECIEHFRWPDVLTVITLEEWNAAFRGARQMPGSLPPITMTTPETGEKHGN